MNLRKRKRLTSFQTIILSFAGVILVGSFILMLPISTKNGVVTPFIDALFTSTSAVCVTGLVVFDTATYWSTFGHAVILAMIQIGGLGVITVAASFALISGRKIGLLQRNIMQEAISASKVGGIVRLTGFIIRASLIIETVGALIMMPVFCRDFGLRGIWLSFFHSISAFCNAGFDIMGRVGNEFQSMTQYAANPVINITLILLIVIGGIGFLTWDDIRVNKHHIHHYRMQTKVILTTTLCLLVFPAIFFYFTEYSHLPTGERVLASLFQSATPRTAGFNTMDLTSLASPGVLVMIALMLIGGSPGSTAGGMKTTTFAVLVSNSFSVFRKKESVHFFKRRIDPNVVKNASTILMMYLLLFITGGTVISMIEGIPLGTCLFETASAIGTVGLSMGITPQLGIVSQSILIILMFFGRVGGLTLIYAAVSGLKSNVSKLPQDKITVG